MNVDAYFYHIRVFMQGSGIPVAEVSGLYWGSDTSVAYHEVQRTVQRDYSLKYPDGINVVFISFYCVR
jgi:hypothetical protein